MTKIEVMIDGAVQIFYQPENETDMFIDDGVQRRRWEINDVVSIREIPGWKSRQTILNEIFVNCADQAQQFRVIGALDAKPSFSVVLDNDNYALARYKMQEAFSEGLITEADLTLVNACIPEDV